MLAKTYSLVRKCSSGFTIIEVIVGAGLLSILVAALASGIFNVDKDMNQIERVTTLNILRMNILSQLQNDWSWKATVADLANTNLACIKNQTACPIQTLRPFKLNDSAGNLIYDSTVPASGFSLSGGQCSTYDDINGSDSCPYHAELSWQPECTLPCVASGLVKVSATLKYNPQSPQLKKSISSQNYNLFLVRNAVVP